VGQFGQNPADVVGNRQSFLPQWEQ
jgi:hypothetical protein